MAKTGNIQTIATERGETTEQVVKAAIETHGSILRAAIALEVAPNTLRYWLRKHNLTVGQKTTVSRIQ